ncbi:MAG: hypothetical protein LBM39_01725 [Candidatus Methanoplasma sp.]|jgi:hypothetical protein|nr:hypothetical protein [Candidatus Methanoplasma sp.]
MDIPAVFATYRNGEVLAGSAELSDGSFSFPFGTQPLSDIIPRADERLPVVVTDVKGFNGKSLDDRLLKNLKVPGSDIWYMTYIRDANDVLDSFMGNAEKILIPYHTVRDRSVLCDAFELSDNCIPVVFSSLRQSKKSRNDIDIMRALDNISSIGFRSMVLFDTDGSVTEEKWSEVLEKHGNTIPFDIIRNPGRSYAGSDIVISGILC